MKYIVGFSGGIDSQAAANWAIETRGAENVILLNADPGGNEHPITTEFIQWFSAKVHPVHICRATLRDCYEKDETVMRHAERLGIDADAPIRFDTLAIVKGRFPRRRAQFCTEMLKLRPSLRWINEHKGIIAEGYERVTGMRRDESKKREDILERSWDSWFQCYVNHPIASWTKEQCFDYCGRVKGQRFNELYMLGFTRVGCAPCVNSSRADIRQWAKRFPKMIDKVRVWEERAGRTFFPPMIPDKEINWIDEVVAWANCEHGGKQFSLDVYTPAPACESIYGLCE